MNRTIHLRWLGILALAAACSNDTSGPPRVAMVLVTPEFTSVFVGQTTQLSASVRSSDGTVLTGRAVTWSSSDGTRALVSTTGLVSGLTAGPVVIRAVSEGIADSAIVTVTLPPANDLSILDAQFTQAIQEVFGSVPIVLNGNAAAVNVLIRVPEANPTAPPVQVVLRLFEANGTPIRTDTANTTGVIGSSPSYAAPTAQFLVPATVLRSGLGWQAEVDPRRLTVDEDRTNNVFPRTGTGNIVTTTVAPLKVRFVPSVLAAHNNSTVTVSTALMPEYLRTLRSVHPLGVITPTIGTAFTTNTSFGTPPSGGLSAFWTQVLSQLDMARMVDPGDPEVHWFGLMRPPAGFNFTTFGGFAYIPPSATTTGANTRTALAVAPGWFSNQAQSRELIAHELGHNFTRRHAPCGSAASPDPQFPQSNGTIGIPGHDVYSWATGLTSSAITMDASSGDVMGYCSPAWVSLYTYGAVLDARGTGPVAATPEALTRAPVLIVRGHITDDRTIQLEPAFVLDGRPTRAESNGRYRLEGRDHAGRLLFSRNFEPAEIDHAPDVRAFTLAIEATPELEAALATVEVRGPTHAARITRPQTVSSSNARVRPNTVTGTSRGVTVRCADTAARAVAVVDLETGSLLAVASSASAQLSSLPRGKRLRIACTDGIRTSRGTVIFR
ncbi:MAG: Ig-like domain-containing protein [Gemmatimonadota bacterium]